MKEILMGYQVDSAFLPVLFSFGDEPHLAESGATNVATNKLEDGQHSKSSRGRTLEGHSPDKHPDVSYQLQYVEENHRSLDRPWSIRHTGVYHHHSPKDAFDLFIFLNPMDESVLEQQLMAYTQPHFSQYVLASICANPMRLHVLPFAAYVHNWRWCLRYWGKQFGERVRICYRLIRNIELMFARMIQP